MRQIDILAAALDRGEQLTPLDSLTLYGVLALSQRMTDLKREGYPVAMEMITLPSGKRVARYRRGGIAHG